ncbi:MAG: DUF5666 domain-containing protein [Acidobacteriota bacterium]
MRRTNGWVTGMALVMMLGLLGLSRGLYASNGDPSEDMEIRGTITSVNGSSLVVGGTTVFTDSQTRIYGEDDQPLAFSELAVGLFVEVEGFPQNGGGLLAKEIKLEDGPEDAEEDVDFKGAISSINGSSLVVAGMQVLTDSQTLIFDHEDQPIPFSSLSVGQVVEVEGTLLSSGEIRAAKIDLEDSSSPDSVDLHAKISSINGSSLYVMGRQVKIVPSTSLFGRGNARITLKDLKVGVDANVRGVSLPDGAIRAKTLHADVSPSHDGHKTVVGPITAKTSKSITVNGLKLMVTSSTRIEVHDTHPGMAGLHIGMRVKVEYTKSGKNLRAKEINAL